MRLMQLSHDLPCRLCRLTFCVLMTLAWSGQPQYVRAAQSAAAGPTPQQQRDQLKQTADVLERSFPLLEQAERELPRDSFEPQAAADRVGHDPQKLFEWVRDGTTLVPYQGTLR